eukprot:scaffold161008_cov37-Tisochrysis_lutea.AAC.1
MSASNEATSLPQERAAPESSSRILRSSTGSWARVKAAISPPIWKTLAPSAPSAVPGDSTYDCTRRKSQSLLPSAPAPRSEMPSTPAPTSGQLKIGSSGTDDRPTYARCATRHSCLPSGRKRGCTASIGARPCSR